jgi:tetratricopeptide (TPR) repeat protein
VLWVYASNAARFEQSFRDIADSVKLAGRQDTQANIFKLVHDWLRACKNRWLLVLDNVDDARFLVDRPAADLKTGARPLREYLPRCEHGSVVVTTRNRQAALKLVEQRDIVEVELMDEPSALALLKKKLGTQADNSKTAELAAVLEYMPLAIVQAAAYISQRASRYSVAKYLDDYRKSERKRTSLLEYDDGHLRRDWEAANSIIVTWQMSFEHIRQTRRSAAELLSLMSFFDRQGIPEDLLRRRSKQAGGSSGNQQGLTTEATNSDDEVEDDSSQFSTSVESEEDTFEDDVVALRNFCFISDETGGTSFEMHALVQLATRTWLAANGQHEQWKQQFISNLSAAFPTGVYEDWAACRPLFAHAKAAAEQRPKEKQVLIEWAALLYRAAWYAVQSGNEAEVKELAVASLKTRQKVLGWEHEDTWWGMAMVADAYSFQGEWKKAEELRKQVMEKRRTKLGVHHPDTLTSMANLAATYWNQGRWKDAEELFVEVIKTSKTKLGVDHPLTLTSIGNLASTYCNQGRWKDAEELFVEVMETRKTELGVNHPDTLTSMHNLASIYRNQGRWKDAKELEEEVTETRRTKLGVHHPDTLTSMANLASTYRKQGRWKAAKELFVEVVKTSKTKLGVDHPFTLTSMANLASTYWNQGRWKDAEELFVEVVKTSKTKLGVDHPDTLTSIGNLASTYCNQGRWKDAEELFVEVIKTSKTKLGVDHPNTLTSMANLAVIYWNQGRWKDAKELEVEVMETRKIKLGVNHPDTLSNIHNLAFT